ncbi:MAG TPA: hypothetical protein VN285_11570 [Candidatus Deferrimicrobium sp.]|nr:hypothetical protein [Candidatus Deferrimicrobium sp.]
MKKTVRKFKETQEIRASLLNRFRSHPYLPLGVFVCACLTAACIHVWQRVKVLDLLTEVSQLRRQNVELLDTAKKINAEITALTLASRIERYAGDTLGLEPVTADRLFTLEHTRPMQDQPRPEGVAQLTHATERVLKYVPTVSENTASARELKPLSLDSLQKEGDRR